MTRRFVVVLGLCAASSLFTATVQAADCEKWVTEFGSLSGEGEALNTSLCSEAAGNTYYFEITCMSKSLNVRFMPEIEGDGRTIDKVLVDYAIDGQSHMVETQFEELDGAFAADLATDAPLVKAMEVGQSAMVTLKNIKAPAYLVPLTNFKQAIAKLVSNCQ